MSAKKIISTIFIIIYSITVRAENESFKIREIEQKSAFPASDSSPNAIVFFKNSVAILSGWKDVGKTVADSTSETWVTTDLVNWKLANKNPPYDPYSRFVVFNNKLLAIHADIYSTDDYIEWKHLGSFPDRFNKSGPDAVIKVGDGLVAYSWGSFYKSYDAVEWEKISTPSSWSPLLQRPVFIYFKDKYYFFGGGYRYGEPPSQYNQAVWSSNDLINWDHACNQLDFIPRIWANVFEYEDKVWLMNGYNANLADEYGNLNDIWVSDNLCEWKEVPIPSWTRRHAAYNLTLNGNVYIIGGYSGGGPKALKNDVYRLSR